MLDLDAIYAALDNDLAFEGMADAVARVCETRSAKLRWREGGATIDRANYWPAEFFDAYVADFTDKDPWLPALAMAENGIVMGDALVSPAAVRGSAMYQELFKPLGDDTARVLAWTSGAQDPRLLISVHRAGGDRCFDAIDARRLDTVRVHVERVLATRARLTAARSSAAELLNATGAAVMTVDRDLNVLDCSPAARAHLDKGDAVRCRRGRLCFVETGLEMKVCAAARSVLDRTAIVPTSFSVPRPGCPEPLLLFVAPTGSDSPIRALLFLNDPAMLPGEPGRRALTDLYGLSAAEISVALMLAQGTAIGAIAESRGVTRETVRTQAKRVYEKTGTARQAALARLVASLPARRV